MTDGITDPVAGCLLVGLVAAAGVLHYSADDLRLRGMSPSSISESPRDSCAGTVIPQIAVAEVSACMEASLERHEASEPGAKGGVGAATVQQDLSDAATGRNPMRRPVLDGSCPANPRSRRWESGGIFMGTIRLLAVTGACACAVSCFPTIAAAAPPKADQRFMTLAAGGGIYEVEVSGWPQPGRRARTSRPTLTCWPRTQSGDASKGLASIKGMVLPADMPADKKAKLDKLSKSSDIDRDFIKQVGLDDHRTDIALLEKASRIAKDAEVKAWFGKTLRP